MQTGNLEMIASQYVDILSFSEAQLFGGIARSKAVLHSPQLRQNIWL